MLSRLRSLLGGAADESDVAVATPLRAPASEVVVAGLPAFPLQAHLRDHDGFPSLDWEAVHAWASSAVEQLARPWPRFRDFAREATLDDAGAASAQRHFGADLGAVVCALVERQPDPAWSPDPGRWDTAPERGAFA